MYRIKLERNLEELKQFGYEKDMQGNYSKKVMKDRNKGWTYFETIEINKDDRIVKTRLYQDCADQEWVGYIEKKGRFIYDLDAAGLLEEINITKEKELRFEAFENLRKENEELNRRHKLDMKTLQEQYTAQIDGLKDTIVHMSVDVFTSQDSFMNVFKNIDKKLNLILGGK
ncbi:MAG: hypothetical protein HFJ53_02145 [Clostridia bacterium]|nr:hypothetical protein [Clostridia bacterium]